MTARDVIIDCDPGIDDALALMLAAASPELQLLGVTTVAGNRPVPQTTRNACRVLAAARCASPVYAGCARPLAHADPRCNAVHGDDGLGGVALPEPGGPQPTHATDFIAQALHERPSGSLTLIAMGPLTNLALVEIRHPGALRRARELLVMGGAAFRRGNVTPHAEFNFHADALAAHVVLEAGAPLTLFALDATQQVPLTPEWIGSLGALPSRCAQAAHAMLAAYRTREPLLHDACPVAGAIDATLYRSEPHVADVDWRDGPTEARLHALRPGGSSVANVGLVTHMDGARVLALVRERIARLP